MTCLGDNKIVMWLEQFIKMLGIRKCVIPLCLPYVNTLLNAKCGSPLPRTSHPSKEDTTPQNATVFLSEKIPRTLSNYSKMFLSEVLTTFPNLCIYILREIASGFRPYYSDSNLILQDKKKKNSIEKKCSESPSPGHKQIKKKEKKAPIMVHTEIWVFYVLGDQKQEEQECFLLKACWFVWSVCWEYQSQQTGILEYKLPSERDRAILDEGVVCSGS